MPEERPRAAADRKRIRTAFFSLSCAVCLMCAKLVVGVVSGSLGVLSSAFDSVADIFMSGVNLVSIRKSMDPADRTHPYGHGKVETLATVLQAGVIGLTGAWVVREGIARLRAGRAPTSADAGIAVMLVGVVASVFISRYIRRAGEETESPALVADSLHFRTDVWSNGGILLSLVIFRFTGWKWIDPGVAIAVGAGIIAVAGKLLYEAIQDLADRTLPAETVALIERIIREHEPMVVDFHDLRTRRSGSEKHVDFHVVVCREHTLDDAHRVADHLEEEIRKALGNAHVVTHLDPCEIECPGLENCARVTERIRELDGPENHLRKGAAAPGGGGARRSPPPESP